MFDDYSSYIGSHPKENQGISMKELTDYAKLKEELKLLKKDLALVTALLCEQLSLVSFPTDTQAKFKKVFEGRGK
tara:strand:+ start:360 stop:584 length:225 start_codon:yes stop_codon:yes gene_type:complete